MIGGTTGIFVGSNRIRPFRNIKIEQNTVRYQTEEGISLDGFGNNASLCPVIANGTITSATNDPDGRLVLTVDLVAYLNDTPSSPSPISERSDWDNFYISFDENSGLEGTVTPIVAFDETNNTLTVDSWTLASDLSIGGECGVHAGFFDCVIKNNTVIGVQGGYGQITYGTGLSVYLNIFNTKVEGNTVISCGGGINVAGGFMLNSYKLRAYNNLIKGNTFLNCTPSPNDANNGVIRFSSLYGDVMQYNNQLVDNVVVGGDLIRYERQRNFVLSNNSIHNVANVEFNDVQSDLPEADATQIGKIFMKVDSQGTSEPVEISYHVCKLAAGAYSWSQIS